MIVGCYIRVSTSEQAEKGYSVTGQTERLKKYCDSHDWIIYKIYTDPGYTGSNTDRPGLKQMLDDINKHKFEKVVCWKLDRLSRSQKDTLTLIEDHFLANDCDFVSMRENFDTSTPFGKAMIGILAVFAQLEREQIKERIALGREVRAQKGYYSGGSIPPYGYKYENKQLIVEPYEAMVVRKIFELALQNKTSYSIAKYLRENEFNPRNIKWGSKSIDHILASRIYIGQVSFSKKWYPGIHEALISTDAFEEVQEIIARRSKKRHAMNVGKVSSYLAGITFCKKCGKKYYKDTSRVKRKEKVYYNYYYCCYGRILHKQTEKCYNKIYAMDALDNMVLSEIKKLAMDPEYFDQVRSEGNPDEDIKIINAEIDKISSQISKLLDLYALDSMPIDVINAKIKNLTDQKEILEKQFDIKNRSKTNKSTHKKDFSKIIMDVADIIDSGNKEEIRNMIHILIDKIYIDGDDVEIHWNF